LTLRQGSNNRAMRGVVIDLAGFDELIQCLAQVFQVLDLLVNIGPFLLCMVPNVFASQ